MCSTEQVEPNTALCHKSSTITSLFKCFQFLYCQQKKVTFTARQMEDCAFFEYSCGFDSTHLSLITISSLTWICTCAGEVSFSARLPGLRPMQLVRSQQFCRQLPELMSRLHSGEWQFITLSFLGHCCHINPLWGNTSAAASWDLWDLLSY